MKSLLSRLGTTVATLVAARPIDGSGRAWRAAAVFPERADMIDVGHRPEVPVGDAHREFEELGALRTTRPQCT